MRRVPQIYLRWTLAWPGLYTIFWPGATRASDLICLLLSLSFSPIFTTQRNRTMNLIGYSDSEDSGDDTPQAPPPVTKPASKPAFQKVVDRSNPGKIKLNLPAASRTTTEKDDLDSEAPPAKKARIGGGGAFGGFNAMLPAPKKRKVEAAPADAPPGKRALGKGLGAGVNLKTGAEPAFKRESKIDLDDYDENGNPIKREERKQDDFRAMLNLPTPKSSTQTSDSDPAAAAAAAPKPVTQAAPRPRFMPKGMGWGKKKKPAAPKPALPSSTGVEVGQTSGTQSSTPAAEQNPLSKPKVSLFGVSQEAAAPARQPTGDYQPLIYGADQEQDGEDAPITDPNFASQAQATAPYAHHLPPASNDLANIASGLNLSEAERRQLFGRKGQGPDFSSARIVEFNTDKEYAHNEMLRQQGETVQHNVLKSISGTGKNSLRSLINVAATQKDALEEHFATGRRNKKEAGNKYGW